MCTPRFSRRLLAGGLMAFALLIFASASVSAQPIFSDLQPADGTVLPSGQGTLTGTVTGATSLSIGGEDVAMGTGGAFSWTYDLPEGPSNIQLYAEDAGGQPASLVHQLVVDTSDPQVTVTQPSSSVVGSTPVEVAGTYFEPHLMSLTVAGVPAMASGGTWNASVPLVEGAQTLTVAAQDSLGHTFSLPVTLTLDTVAPSLSVTESGVPFTGGLYHRPVTPVISASDATALSVELVLDGAPFVSGTTVSEEGNHQLDAIATDAGGNVTSVQIDFVIDTTPPTLGVVTPAAGTVLATVDTTLQIEADGADRVRVTGPGGAVETTGSGLFTVGPVALVEGEVDLSIEAFDDAGNRSTRTHRLVRDTTPPVLTVTAPSDGDVVSTATVPARGLAQDARLDSVTVNGQLANLVGEGWSVADVPLADGANVLTVVATDAVGNQTSDTVTVQRDTAAPIFQVLVNGVELVSGTTFSGPVSPVIQVDDVQFPGATVAATLDGSPFTSGTEVAADGSHELSVTVTSSGGVSSSKLLVFVIDQQAPTISEVLPADGHLQQGAEVRLSGTVTGAQVVTVDGQPAVLYQGSFSAGPFTLTEGVRTFAIIATGANGIETTRQHTVERDSTPPQVAIGSPADGALVGDVAITVSGTAIDPNLSTVTVNETPSVVSASTWNAQGVPLREGSTTLTARAEDLAGNVAEATRTVILDTEAPQVTITDPVAGTLVPDATYEVRGTVIEEHLDRIDVSVTAVSTGDTSTVRASVDGSTFFVDVPLADGTNQITVTARDRLGATSTDSASIERDADAPQVRIVVPGDGESVSNSSLEVRGTVNNEDGITVRVNGLVALIDQGAWTVAGVDLSPGENRLLARATDAQGNEGIHTRIVHLDQEPPTFLSADPASGALALPVDAVFRLEFSEPLAEPNEGSWTLTAAGNPLVATAVVDGSDLRITPQAPLPSEAQVVLTLSSALTDRAGNFLANPPAPLVYDVVDAGAPDAVVLDFDPARFLCSPDVVLSGSAEPGARVEADGGASSTWVRAGDTGTFLLTVELLTERLNRLELTATDFEGNVSVPTVVEVVHDCTGPEVVSSQLQGQTLTIGFTEAMDETTLTSGAGGSLSVRDAAGELAFTISASGDSATLSLASAPAGSVLLDVTVGVRDLAANALAYPYRRVFGDAAGAESFVSGTVIDDATGRPLAGATVQVTSTNGSPLGEPLPQQTTGADGRFLIPVAAGTHDLTAARPDYSPVFRIVTSTAGEGTDVFDPRLAPLSASSTVPTSGGVVQADTAPESGAPAAQLTLPSGALNQAAAVTVTQLSEQALTALLPYGWSPRGAAWIESTEDFQTAGTLSLPVRSSLGTTPAGTLLHLVTLDLASLQWDVIGQATVANGRVQVTVPAIGAYVAVEADTGPMAPPAAVVGQVLGSSPSPVGGEVAAAHLSFDPEVVLPTQRARATAGYTLAAGAEDAPSGLPLTLVIEEELELLDGSILREAPYRTDLVVYRDGLGDPSSEFWLRPSDTARREPLQLGGEDVTVLPYGDESVRGNVLGPEGGIVLSDDGDQLDVPAGALAGPAAIVLERQTPADLPLATPRGAVVDAVLDLDLGGARLEAPAGLSISLSPAPPTDAKGLLLQVVEVEADQGSETRFRVLAELLPTSGGWETDVIDPLDLAWPGVRSGGQLAAVRLTEPHGFVRGQVVASGGGFVADAVVSSASVDWLQITDAEGRYVLPLPLGNHVVSSRSPQTGNAVEVAVTVAGDDERIDLDPTLQVVAPWIQEVTPADGAEGIPVGVEPTVRFSEPIDRTSLAAGLELLLGGVAVSVEFDHQGDLVRILPQATLVPGHLYELRIGAEIRDLDGYTLNGILTTSFRTEADPTTSDRLDRSKIRTIAPDHGGLATVVGEAGAVPGESLVYVENLTSYSTTESITAGLDGSFQLTIGASLDDRLLLHVLIEGSSEDLMTLGPFLSADRKSAYVPEDGAEWTTVEGLGIEVQPDTFARPTWVRAETRAEGPIETPEGFDALFDFNITFDGLLPSKSVYVRVPTAASVDPNREILLNRFVDVLGVRGWMFMDFLRLEGNLLTNAPLDPEAGNSTKASFSLATGEVSVYAAPERQGVWSLANARLEREAPGSVQFAAPVRISRVTQQQVERRRAIYQHQPLVSQGKSQPITNPHDSALGLVDPGTYQGSQLQAQQPIAWAAIPVDRPDLLISSDSFGGAPYVTQLTTHILTVMTGPWVIIPTRWNEEFTLEVRDLTTGYVLGRSVQAAPTQELTLYPEDVYADDAPPLPVGGNPIRFYLLNPADGAQGQEIAEGITYDYDHETFSVLGAPDSVPEDVEITLYSAESGERDSTVSGATGGFSLTLQGVEAHQPVVLAVSAKVGPGETLEIRFSEAIQQGAPGIELHAEAGGSVSPNPVGSSKTLRQDGTLLRIRPNTGWKKGRYELRFSEELLGTTDDGEPREFEIGLTVEGSSYLETLELDNVGDMAQLGSLLYMAALGDGLVVWDVTHPKAPRPMLTDENGDPYGFPFPNGGAVRGVDIDSHGRAVVVGGGEVNFGQLKLIDLLAVDWQAATNASNPSTAAGEAFRGSTLISDSLTGTIQTALRDGTPRRVAVASNDTVDAWRIWADAPPAGVTIQPATKPSGVGLAEVQVQFSGSGVEPEHPVSVHNITRGRWDRGEADSNGDWSVTASLRVGDEIELRRNSDVWAYATIDGGGIAVVDVASIVDEDHSDPNIAASIVQVADGLPVSAINAEHTCDPNRVDISNQPVDIEVLYDADKSPQLSILTLYTGYGMGIQAASPSEPGVLGAVSAACGAVDGAAVLSALEVAQNYPMDFDGDGQFGSNEKADYAILGHSAGHILIFDITQRHAPIKVAQIPLGKAGEEVRLASLSVDRRHRRILAAAFGEGLYVVDFNTIGAGSLGRIDVDQNGVDDRVLETIEVTSEEVTELLLMPDFGIAFAAGRQRGLTSLLVGPPRVETVSADRHPLRFVSRAAPYGVSTAPESEQAGSAEFPGLVRFQVQMPGLSDDASSSSLPRSHIYLDVAGVGPEEEPIDGAGEGTDVPPVSFLGQDAMLLERQADDPWEEGYRLYISEPVVLLSDLRASAAYEEHEDELDVCTRCDLVEEEVYTERPLAADDRYDEMLSGHKILAAFTDRDMEQDIERFYEDSPFQRSVSRVASVPWDISPSIRQEPRHHPATGQGDVAPGTLLHSGEMTLSSTDVSIAGRGLHFAFHRTYRNQTVGSGPLGPGWDHSYRMRLRELPDGSVEVFDGQGRRDRFELQDDGELEAPQGWFVDLQRTSAGWTLTDPGRNLLRFDRWGRLVSISDPLRTDEDRGNQMRFHYDSRSRLQRVDDALERAIHFEYDDDGKLTSLRDFTDRQWSYGYDSDGLLETFDAPAVATLDNKSGSMAKSVQPLRTTYSYSSGGSALRDRLGTRDNLAKVTDPKGQEWLELVWDDADGDGLDDEIKTQTWGEHTLTLSIDTDGHTTQVTDRRGNVNEYQFNSDGQTTRVTDPKQAAWIFEYDDEGLLKKRTEPDGRSTETTFDTTGGRRARGNTKTITVNPGAGGENGSEQSLVTRMEYHPKTNRAIEVISPKGTVTEIDRDPDTGLARAITRAKGTEEESTESFSYNDYGQVREITDPLGTVTKFEYYDAEAGDPEEYEGYAKHIVEDVTSFALQTSFEVDDLGRRVAVVDARGVRTEFDFNDLGWHVETRTAVTGSNDGAPPLNYVTTVEYDANGNVARSQVPVGASGETATSEITYGLLDEVKETKQQAGANQEIVETWDYDENYNPIRHTDGEGQISETDYDERNLPEAMRRGLGANALVQPIVEQLLFDDSRRFKVFTDGRSNAWTREYDGYGRVRESRDPLGNKTQWEYDNHGQAMKIQAFEGETLLSEIGYVYDARSRMTSMTQKMLQPEGLPSGKTSPSGDLVTRFDYDDLGNVTKVTDPKGRDRIFTYDSMHRMETVLDSMGNLQRLMYDTGSNVVQSTMEEMDGDGAQHNVPTTFGRDALGRMTERRNALGHVWTYHLGADGLARRTTDAGGFTTTYSYDLLSRMTGLTRPEGVSETYTYDKSHR
ncbi:MAG: Ig-like domain-containing protein, partial [Thermoanaerobaculia bacterium]|nr:Ig-like domain-containing protein [Thermoanaerobaculia bacterium]